MEDVFFCILTFRCFSRIFSSAPGTHFLKTDKLIIWTNSKELAFVDWLFVRITLSLFSDKIIRRKSLKQTWNLIIRVVCVLWVYWVRVSLIDEVKKSRFLKSHFSLISLWTWKPSFVLTTIWILKITKLLPYRYQCLYNFNPCRTYICDCKIVLKHSYPVFMQDFNNIVISCIFSTKPLNWIPY